MESYNAYKAAAGLWKVISPIFIVLGNAGNVLVIIVFMKQRSNRSATSTYLSALALSDILALDTGLVRQWVKYTFAYDIRTDHTEMGCRFHWFIVYLVTQFSSWMLACVTCERFILTWKPHRKDRFCNKQSSIIVVIVIFVCLIMLNGHYLFGYGHVYIDSDNTTIVQKCIPITDNYDSFILYTWTWIDLAIFYLIPMLILGVGNSLIAYKVLASNRRAKRTVAPANGASTTTTSVTRVSNLTKSLMFVCVVFMICITPIVVFPIGQPYWERGATDKKLADMFLIETIANLLMYLNHSINFLLYFLSGTVFRNSVKMMFCGRRASINSVSQTMAIQE